MNSSLEIIVGSTQDIEVEVLDSSDVTEDLSLVEEATLTIKADVEAVASALERSITNSNLSIAGGSVIATLNSTEADALVPGYYTGQVFLRFGASDWRVSTEFSVRIKLATANKV